MWQSCQFRGWRIRGSLIKDFEYSPRNFMNISFQRFFNRQVHHAKQEITGDPNVGVAFTFRGVGRARHDENDSTGKVHLVEAPGASEPSRPAYLPEQYAK